MKILIKNMGEINKKSGRKGKKKKKEREADVFSFPHDLLCLICFTTHISTTICLFVYLLLLFFGLFLISV